MMDMIPVLTEKRLLTMELQILTEPMESFSIQSAILTFDGMSYSASQAADSDRREAKQTCKTVADKIQKQISKNKTLPIGTRGLWASCLTRASSGLGDSWYSDLAAQVLQSTGDSENPLQLTRPDTLNASQPHPIQFPSALLDLYERTESASLLARATRWGKQLAFDGIDPKTATAEDYGRAIRFLHRLGKISGEERYRLAAQKLAEQSLEQLFDQKSRVFRSRPGINRCRDEDGIGILMQALLLVF